MSDPRTLFALPEVAHTSLQGTVEAATFTDGERKRVHQRAAPIYRTATEMSLERESLFGAEITLLAVSGTRGFVRDETMGYVGYMPLSHIRDFHPVTHWVAVRATLVFKAPDMKTPAPAMLSLGSQVEVLEINGAYAQIGPTAYVYAAHLSPLERRAQDPVAVAESLIGAPYLWGGNTSLGLDCSGLVQLALSCCGTPCPGDSDQQEAGLGETLPDGTAPHRGDLLFWKGHVAWVADDTRLLHANAHAMAVRYEPLADAVARIEAQGGGPVTRHARLRV